MKRSSTTLHPCYCYCFLMFLLSRLCYTSSAYSVVVLVPRTTTRRLSLGYRPSFPAAPSSLHRSNHRTRMASSSFSNTETTTTKPPAAPVPPTVSSRIQTTLDPCVVLMKDLIGQYAADWDERGGIYSLAQGIVWWTPPAECQEALLEALTADHDNQNNALLHLYGPDEGLPELRAQLQHKVATENGLPNHDIMVTVGANQAYVNCVLTLLSSPTDRAVVFTPYYFNHYMALQMTMQSPQDQILEGPTSEEGLPDLDWLEDQFQYYNDNNSSSKIQMVTLVNPGNPTGTALSRAFVQRAVDLCRQHGAWLILDATYENFVNWDSGPAAAAGDADASLLPFDACFAEPHCIHIFSFSKAYALAGYRCGYLALHPEAAGGTLYAQMLKVQDTVPIAPSRLAQVAALGALKAGPAWVRQKVATLATGRAAVKRALAPLGSNVMGGSGAMYLMAKLPNGTMDDREIAERLVREHGVAVIPGSFCGFPGWIRVCYANLPPDRCVEAAERLERGLREIVSDNSNSGDGGGND